nr:E3 ubiquitin-protein ligase PRT6-like isoform X1 [Tanacetum cinerariifolium]
MNLEVKFENASKAKDDMRKAYEECNDIPKEKCALIDICLKEESDKEYETHNALFRKAENESLLGFVSGRLCFVDGLLDLLVEAEGFLSTDVVRKLQELLLKLLSDPFFKYEFAKAFLRYYPKVINACVKECGQSLW